MSNELATTVPMVLRVTRGRSVKEAAVATVNEASAWWCQYRDERGLAASTAPRVELVVAGEVRGHVSYNGKVWEGSARDWEPGRRPLFDPFAEVVG
jgi:hypothetical protein